MDKVRIYCRKHDRIEEEKIFGHAALSFFYPSKHAWYRLFGRVLCFIYASIPFFSRFYGWIQSLPFSKKKVPCFIKSYGVKISDFEKETFSSFNDFFVRKLRQGARSFDSNPEILIAPADARYLVIPDITTSDHFFVKGQKFDLASFLGDEKLAADFSGGTLVLARLCPSDYHRFHFPCVGAYIKPKCLPGKLFSVNPIALCQSLSYLWRNKRWIGVLQRENSQKMLYVPIGATNVGSATFTALFEKEYAKGDELGFFSFGASAVALIFEKDSVTISDDLRKYSAEGIEVKLDLGEALGVFSKPSLN